MDARTFTTSDPGTAPKRPRLSPINQRRLANFKANGRGYWSLWIFLFLFVLALLAEFITNDRPILVSYKGDLLAPVFVDYPEERFGGFLAVTDYRDPFIQDEINANGWMVWPLVRYSYRSVNNEIPIPAPAPPSWTMEKEERCQRYPLGADDPNCVIGNWNWLGTDDQARDVLARLVYGFRISVLFGLVLTLASSVIGIAAGAVQGYYGGWVDLGFQTVHRGLDRDPDALPDPDRVIRADSRILDVVHNLAGVFLGGSGRRGACRVPARTEL